MYYSQRTERGPYGRHEKRQGQETLPFFRATSPESHKGGKYFLDPHISQFLEGFCFNLANTLAGDPELLADLL